MNSPGGSVDTPDSLKSRSPAPRFDAQLFTDSSRGLPAAWLASRTSHRCWRTNQPQAAPWSASDRHWASVSYGSAEEADQLFDIDVAPVCNAEQRMSTHRTSHVQRMNITDYNERVSER